MHCRKKCSENFYSVSLRIPMFCDLQLGSFSKTILEFHSFMFMYKYTVVHIYTITFFLQGSVNLIPPPPIPLSF